MGCEILLEIPRRHMADIIIMVKQKVVEPILHRHASVLQALLLAERNRYEVAVGWVSGETANLTLYDEKSGCRAGYTRRNTVCCNGGYGKLLSRHRCDPPCELHTPVLLLHRKIPFMAQYHERIVPDILQLDDLQAKLLLKCVRIFFEIFFAFGFFYFSATLFFFGGLLFFVFVFFSKS